MWIIRNKWLSSYIYLTLRHMIREQKQSTPWIHRRLLNHKIKNIKTPKVRRNPKIGEVASLVINISKMHKAEKSLYLLKVAKHHKIWRYEITTNLHPTSKMRDCQKEQILPINQQQHLSLWNQTQKNHSWQKRFEIQKEFFFRSSSIHI